MSDTSAIEWTEATWNPVVGCEHVSPGCDHCYAARLVSGRLRHQHWYAGLAEHGRFTGEVRMIDGRLDQPLKWKKPRRVFVNSMSDLFHESVPDEFIARVWQVMAATPQHTYQVLTKRHARMRAWFRRWPNAVLTNLWVGVSVENQRWADIRIPALLDTPATVRFLSCEPLLGPVKLPLFEESEGCTCGGYGPPYYMHERWCGLEPGPGLGNLHWVITGGESGPGARMASPDWFRAIRDQCQAAGVAYFHKQNGPKKLGRELDGRTWDEYPEVAR